MTTAAAALWPTVRRWASTVGLFIVALACWALASPVGSAPDEDFHIANIYCVADHETCRSDDIEWPLGYPWWPPDPADRTGPAFDEARTAYANLWAYPQPRELPCFVRNGHAWYTPDSAVGADCLDTEDPTDNTPASVDRIGYYPNTYYQVMSWLTSGTIRESVVAWRLANAVIFVLLVSLSIAASKPTHRTAIALAVLVSSVPFGIFLVSSMNPSAWAVIGTAALVGPALALVGSPWRWAEAVPRLALMSMGSVMVAGSRSEGIVSLGVAIGLVLLLEARGWPRRALKGWLLLASALVLTGLIASAFTSSKLSQSLRSGWEAAFGGSSDQAVPAWDVLSRVPGLYLQAHDPLLGWLEIQMPDAVALLAGAAFWGALFFGLAAFYRRKALGLVFVVLAMLIIPAMTMLRGEYQQARYFLPLLYLFAFAMLMPEPGRHLNAMSRAQRGALVLALAIANSLALLQTTVRYVSGLTPGSTSPRSFAAYPVPEWWWDHWLSPFANWVLGSAAFALGCLLLLCRPGGPSQGTEVEHRAAPPAGVD